MPRPEAGQELTYSRELLTQTYSQVWSHFPEPLRPDLGVLLPLLSTGGIRRRELTIHPGIPDMYRLPMVEAIDIQRVSDEVNQEAYYDPATRAISTSPNIFDNPESEVRAILAHEVGHDLSAFRVSKTPQEYSAAERQMVMDTLRHPAALFLGITLEDTTVIKTGFRKRLEAGGYALTELNPQVVEYHLDEIFPTMFAMVTQMAMERGGNLKRMEKDLKQGKVKVSMGEDHPAFFAAFVKAARVMKWQELLLAFKDGELDTTMAFFTEHFGRNARDAFEELAGAMDEDEVRLKMANARNL